MSRKVLQSTQKDIRPFPIVTLEDTIEIAQKIKELNGGNPWSPSEIANALGASSKTNSFYYLTAGSRDYGFTEGSRNSKEIGLTDLGRAYAYAESTEDEKKCLQSAFFNVEIFKDVYNHYKGSTLPELKFLANTLEGKFRLSPKFHLDFHRIFQANCHLKIW